MEQAGFGATDFDKPSVLRILRYLKKDEAIAAGLYFQEQFDTDMFKTKKAKTTPGWTSGERQALQVQLSKNRDNNHRLNRPVLDDYLAQWNFPAFYRF